VIVSLPAIEGLRTEYLEVWTGSAQAPLVRCADRVRAIPDTGLDLLGVADPEPRLVEALRGFDSIVSWYGSNRPEFRMEVASLGFEFEFLPALPPASGPLHAVDFYLEQTAPLRLRAAPCTPRIPAPPASRKGAVLHPFSGSVRKNWPLARFQDLAAALGDLLPVEWCAGPSDMLPDAIRIDNLYDLACRLAAAQVFVGNDSGIGHLAAAVGAPLVSLFGPTDPAVWAPRGPRVQVIRAAEMEAIPLAAVREAAEALIK
jgi:hypothetical protein